MRIVGGRFRGKTLTSPEDDSIRPTADRTRESVFNILASRLGPSFDGLRVLDLFAGTGALGLEALSRGAAHVTFVDTGAEARGLIRDHIEAFGAGGVAKLLRRDATALGPAGTLGPVDLVFLDPPYGQGLGERALVSLRDNGWLQADTLLVLEESADAAVTLPEGFVLDDRRDYGAAAVHLIRVS
ncbi:MAG: 16S rRNA (guanine(966)-N(2))-methyltransferase RsmD [Devosia sp. 67-54]|uniref:16S rRNA (guanine(966)-N(2))-methyltransferase RsmD n=1 Tax=unclassified Devosia TaxID=196773 RepID=UPI000968AF2B|nr:MULTISPECIES: 16S rRNA (guanine(966)-N(2))-methyltransferase RsmD [unclassified Devosia]MBN9305311.1 16S rRNA (guanine(966)-N(2))-methyltransferase RsmD [Devosia sp.]OJX18913.1 MAG: 16S rRNA (guanine(966)-N(2))-methyltransferase RsmD [Devosia sp. 67-54]